MKPLINSENNEKIDKCLLLYSGGLDTSVMLKWIQETYDCDLYTLTLDIGQKKDLDQIKKKALKLGAKDAIVLDVKKEFADNYVSKAIKANALYEGVYPVSTAIARPLKVNYAVKVAFEGGFDAIAHGCSGKGNDQVRLDIGIHTLAPFMKIVAPVREWNMSRDKEIEYAKKTNIPIPNDYDSPYSTDENIWGKSYECGLIEFPDRIVPTEIQDWAVPPELAPNTPEIIAIGFEKGVPVSLNNERLELWQLIVKLNEIAGAHGVGLIDHTEDRIVGLKSREYYVCPAAMVILKAHRDLEKYVCTIHENQFKTIVDQQWTYYAYAGLWFEPLMRALEAFVDKMNEKVQGWVKVKLYKGSAMVVARESPNALYDLKLATYETGETFNQSASPGFIELWGLQSRVAYAVSQNLAIGKEPEKMEKVLKIP